jgi:hypothetical protein
MLLETHVPTDTNNVVTFPKTRMQRVRASRDPLLSRTYNLFKAIARRLIDLSCKKTARRLVDEMCEELGI